MGFVKGIVYGLKKTEYGKVMARLGKFSISTSKGIKPWGYANIKGNTTLVKKIGSKWFVNTY